MGVLNVAVSAFMLGRAPQLYWAYAGIKSVALNGVSYHLKRRDHQRLYLFDLCHVLSLRTPRPPSPRRRVVVSEARPAVAPYTSSPAAFRAAFALANGPLGVAVPTLANALVLHSPRQTAALFIHISPPIVTWARGGTPRRTSARSRILPTRTWATKHAVAYEALVAPALRTYFAWWLAFAVWMMLDGRRRGNVGNAGPPETINPKRTTPCTTAHLAAPRRTRWENSRGTTRTCRTRRHRWRSIYPRTRFCASR